MRVYEAVSLMERYGENLTLGSLVKKIQGNKIYKCPKCKGTGRMEKKCWLYDREGGASCTHKYVDCDLCYGEGYTDCEYKPKMVQDGWE